MKNLILIPRMSEKAYNLSISKNTYVFDVPLSTNKIEIKKAVQAQFDVLVTDVNTVRHQGKVKRAMSSKRRSVTAKRSDNKRAYVTLAEGNSLPLFSSIEESAAPVANEKPKEKDKKKGDK